MLTLSQKLFENHPDVFQEGVLCFHVKKNKLTLKQGKVTEEYITHLPSIAEKINQSSKPVFASLDSFYETKLKDCKADGSLDTFLNFYKSGKNLWKVLDLAEEFSSVFKDDNQFLSSELTFMEIVSVLEQLKSSKSNS